jgi:hypothetical protein
MSAMHLVHSKEKRMKSHTPPRPRIRASALALVTISLNTVVAGVAFGASASTLNREATQALRELYGGTPGAKALGEKAVGVLIFPSIKKGGFIIYTPVRPATYNTMTRLRSIPASLSEKDVKRATTW